MKSSLLKSRIGRRILLQFMLVAVVPLLVFTAYTLSSVRQQLVEQSEERLNAQCKSIGMSATERMGYLCDDLILLCGDGFDGSLSVLRQASERPRERFDKRFVWLAVTDGKGAVLDSSQPGVKVPTLSNEERVHLTKKPASIWMEPRATGRDALLLFLSVPSDGADRYLVGEVRPEFLWVGKEGHRPNTGLAILSENGGVLFSSDDSIRVGEVFEFAQKTDSSKGQFEWDAGQGQRMASYRTVFTAPRFFRSFFVIQSQAREFVLQPVKSFEKIFILFALLLFGSVLLASLRQIRRSLVPIGVLRAGTQKLALGEIETQVDITSQDEFEDLGRSFNTMAQSIRERTEELERANRVKADFLANISHEIRTPMTAMLGFTELLLEEGLSDSEREKHLAVIHDNGKHLVEIVDEILDISRIEAGEVRVQLKPCDITSLIGGVASLLSLSAKKKGLTFDCLIDPKVPAKIVTDSMRVRQVLINVIGNAVKYTERGEVSVRVEWQPAVAESANGAELLVRVRDTGIGIPFDRMAEIFDPFCQVDESMSRQYGGTGLGLALARSLTQKLGGDMSCTSEVGVGSEFVIRLNPGELDNQPAVSAELSSVTSLIQPDESAPQPSLNGTVSTAGGVEQQRVLLVEDVPMNRKLVAAILKKSYRIEEAENGLIGFELAQAAWESGEPYAVILMDMQMPVMDGYQAAQRLREVGYSAPIVALTAHANEGDRERCLEAGCDEYTTKPVNRKALLELVASFASKGLSQEKAV